MIKLVVEEKSWLMFKRRLWSRLWEDLEIGYLDKDLLPILILFNLDRDVYTLSSCSGRIVVSDSVYPWSRDEGSIVLKTHVPVKPGDLAPLLKKPVVRRLWLNATGPIVHLSARNMRTATYLLKVARMSGYKHSGILSLNKYKGVIIELTTGVRFSTFIGDGSSILETRDIGLLVEKANEILLYGKLMLNRLYEVASKHLPRYVDEEVLKDIGQRGGLLKKKPIEIFAEMARDKGLGEFVDKIERMTGLR